MQTCSACVTLFALASGLHQNHRKWRRVLTMITISHPGDSSTSNFNLTSYIATSKSVFQAAYFGILSRGLLGKDCQFSSVYSNIGELISVRSP